MTAAQLWRRLAGLFCHRGQRVLVELYPDWNRNTEDLRRPVGRVVRVLEPRRRTGEAWIAKPKG